MDTSLEYVKMCKGATEIQSQWKFEIGDHFNSIEQATLHRNRVAAGLKDKQKWCSIVDQWWLDEPLTKKHLENGTMPEPWAWLPRQDQLQEMLSEEHRIIHRSSYAYMKGHWPNGFIFMVLLEDFHVFLDYEYEYINYIAFDSAEQLWLAYVMDHRYEKRWDGSKWIPRGGESFDN